MHDGSTFSFRKDRRLTGVVLDSGHQGHDRKQSLDVTLHKGRRPNTPLSIESRQIFELAGICNLQRRIFRTTSLELASYSYSFVLSVLQ